jgi:DNA-binding FrmR family transcriptional regulator
MRFDSDAVPEGLDRLRKIEGQLGGIIKMLEQGRDCSDVVQQLAAVGRGVDRVGLRLLTSQLKQCLNDEDTARDAGYSEEKFERLFLMLG